jgi:G:T-mismatch repair DNA endonuclease (very short patch repair protein)
VAKFEANRRRDERKADELRDRGYTVVTVWECETEDERALQKRLRKELPRL